jgi:energy-coupling factor transporter transmembrane protein EcfT
MTFNPYSIFLGVVFSGVGFVAWRYGRLKQSARHLLLAIALMLFGYFIPNPWWVLIIGAVLTTFLFWP